MPQVVRVVVYGTGGLAREVELITSAMGCEIVAYLDDALAVRSVNEKPPTLYDRPVFRPDDYARIVGLDEHVQVLIAAGDPASREAMFHTACGLRFKMPPFVHPTASIGPRVELDDGVVVQAGCVVTCDAVIHECAFLNANVFVAHDVEIGAFSCIQPGAAILGRTVVGEGCYVAAGAVIIHAEPGSRREIAAGTTIGAQACVTKDIAESGTYVGVPAHRLR